LQTALELRVAVLALAMLLIVVGVRMAPKLPARRLPRIRAAVRRNSNRSARLVREEVESLVTVPLENSLNGTAGLKTIRSKSGPRLVSIVMILSEGADLDHAAARPGTARRRSSAPAGRRPSAGHFASRYRR